MNLPNKLTVVRIILVPFILLLMLPLPFGEAVAGWNHFLSVYGMIPALLLFIAAAVTDFFDGRIARARQLITNLGKFLDPIADKLLVVSVLIALTQLNRVHAFVPILILFRDMVVNGVRMLCAADGVVVAANAVGKWKTFAQMAGLVAVMLQLSLRGLGVSGWGEAALGVIGDIMIAASVVLAIVSVVQYVRGHRAALRG